MVRSGYGRRGRGRAHSGAQLDSEPDDEGGALVKATVTRDNALEAPIGIEPMTYAYEVVQRVTVANSPTLGLISALTWIQRGRTQAH